MNTQKYRIINVANEPTYTKVILFTSVSRIETKNRRYKNIKLSIEREFINAKFIQKYKFLHDRNNNGNNFAVNTIILYTLFFVLLLVSPRTLNDNNIYGNNNTCNITNSCIVTNAAKRVSTFQRQFTKITVRLGNIGWLGFVISAI